MPSTTYMLRVDTDKYESIHDAYDTSAAYQGWFFNSTFNLSRLNARLAIFNPATSTKIIKIREFSLADEDTVSSTAGTAFGIGYAQRVPVISLFRAASTAFQGGIDVTSEVRAMNTSNTLDSDVKVYISGSTTTASDTFRRELHQPTPTGAAFFVAHPYAGYKHCMNNALMQTWNSTCQPLTVAAGEMFGINGTDSLGPWARTLIVRFSDGTNSFLFSRILRANTKTMFAIVNPSGSGVTLKILGVEWHWIHVADNNAAATPDAYGLYWHNYVYNISDADADHAQAELTPVSPDSSNTAWSSVGAKIYANVPVVPFEYSSGHDEMGAWRGHHLSPLHAAHMADGTIPSGSSGLYNIRATPGLRKWPIIGKDPGDYKVLYPGSGIAWTVGTARWWAPHVAYITLTVEDDPDYSAGGGGGPGPMVRTFA